MKNLLVLAALLTALAFVGCSTYYPVAVTENPIGSKVGETSMNDGGILQAAKNGGITKIATVDYKETRFLWFTSRTYIVSGE